MSPLGEVHRYQYRVYALGVETLDLHENAPPAMVGFMARTNAISFAKLTAFDTLTRSGQRVLDGLICEHLV